VTTEMPWQRQTGPSQKGSTTASEQECLGLIRRWADVELGGDADGCGDDPLAPDLVVGAGAAGMAFTNALIDYPPPP
jgi:hypothetical protein